MVCELMDYYESDEVQEWLGADLSGRDTMNFSMGFSEYQRLAMRTRAYYESQDEQIMCAVLGILGEGGELAEIIKKVRYQGHPCDDERIIDEAGDILWYIALLCHALGFDMIDVALMNIRKLRNRYPDGFEAERSVNREE